MFGSGNQASGTESGNFVAGFNNQASGFGSGNFVAGVNNMAAGFDSGNFVAGANNQASGAFSGNFVAGFNNQAEGFASGNLVAGSNNQASGVGYNAILGFNNIATGVESGNGVVGSDNIAIGTGAGNGGVKDRATAIGTGAWAGTDAVAVGTGAFAAGPNDTAVGAGATVLADHSTALGAGAVAEKENLFVMGTKQDTYRAPGIVSQLSKDRQTDGKIEIVTSDQGGNLATDGGFVFDKIDQFDDHFKVVDRRLARDDKRIDENKSGIALAISMENPDLIGNERFGVAMNYGNFEGANALSWSAMGVLGYDVLSAAATGWQFRVASVWALRECSGDDVWGGRVGAQWTWGRKPVPYVF